VAVAEDAYPPTLEIGPTGRSVDADVTLPGSKSITNRALIIAALANGRTKLTEALFSDDTRYMSQALGELGIPVDADQSSATFTIDGAGGRIPARSASLFTGNSGTSARFLTALVALGNGTYTVDGVERMRQRPIAPLTDALNQLGVSASSDAGNGCPPITVRTSGLAGGEVFMPGNTSSQYFTALLMIAPLTDQGISITVEGELVSKPYLDMTIATMEHFGATVVHENYRRFTIPGGQRYTARAYAIEPDASAASYFFALAAVTGGRVRVRNLGSSSVQGDTHFVDVLEQMGCTVVRVASSIEVTGPGKLAGVDVDMNAISDTMPTLAAIAPLATEPVNIRNVEHVRHKETDRISAVVNELRKLGVTVDERQDGLTVHPGNPKPGTVDTYDDHRMAMSFAILGSICEGIVISDPGCVAKTFPDFFERLKDAVRH
jgi:3-phosphoshikimate 1-carboxyvinyltransferase